MIADLGGSDSGAAMLRAISDCEGGCIKKAELR